MLQKQKVKITVLLGGALCFFSSIKTMETKPIPIKICDMLGNSVVFLIKKEMFYEAPKPQKPYPPGFVPQPIQPTVKLTFIKEIIPLPISGLKAKEGFVSDMRKLCGTPLTSYIICSMPVEDYKSLNKDNLAQPIFGQKGPKTNYVELDLNKKDYSLSALYMRSYDYFHTKKISHLGFLYDTRYSRLKVTVYSPFFSCATMTMLADIMTQLSRTNLSNAEIDDVKQTYIPKLKELIEQAKTKKFPNDIIKDLNILYEIVQKK